MMRKRKVTKQDNRGVTLVELICAIAILALVTTAGLVFFTRALKLFNQSGRETTIQNEAQLTASRLQSLIVNTTCGVSVPTATSGAAGIVTGNELYVYNKENPVASGGATTFSYKITHIYQEDNELKYCYISCTKKPDGTFEIGNDKENALVLTDYLNTESGAAFVVDVTGFAKTKLVKITVDYKNNEKTYLSESQFLLRNAVSVSTDGSAEDYFKVDTE